MKEEIFDFGKHKGRRIKVLINYPLGGNVKKGEIGVLKYDNVADFPSQSGYCCGGGDNFYKRFELLPEDAVKEPQFEVVKRYKLNWVGFDKKVDFGNFLRVLRIIAAFLTLLLPGLYIAITSFHQEILPTSLLFSR